ncbi:MAG: GGDEF domain-containing protein [Chloroflexota bacterium]
MLDEIAGIITAHIDEITRKWVDELRRTERTEIHNQLLTSEIVNGIKGMLANLAEAIAAQEMPDNEVAPLVIVTSQRSNKSGSLSPQGRPKGTAPLSGPLARAQQAAASHGIQRHNQNYEIHEVLIEYVKLRQILWETLESSLSRQHAASVLDAVQYIDRLLDELMLVTVENFYSASVRDLEKRALRDPLTQLYNKEYFSQRLGEEMRRAVRSGDPLSVAMLDMDRLKEINDTYGHPAGDSVILAVASAIRDTCRRSDIPCRYGGDEFAVILPDTGKVQGRVFAERVMRAVQNLTVVLTAGEGATRVDDLMSVTNLSRTKLPVVASVPTLSIGLATFPEDARNPETLLARADGALYRAKNEGRNRIVY